MNRRFNLKKLAGALTLCGVAFFSLHANAAYIFRVSLPGLKADSSLSSSGASPSTVLSADVLSFGTVYDYSTTTQSLTITNSGSATASPTFSSSSSNFSVSGCSAIPAGSSCTATVTLVTSGAGSYSSTLTINGNTAGPVTTSLSATSQKVVQSFTTVGASSWTVPARVTQVSVLVVGGGGGPQAGGTGATGGTGGGGGQVAYNAAYTVTPGLLLPSQLARAETWVKTA